MLAIRSNLELLALGKVETVEKEEVIIRAAWLKCYRKATKIRNLFISKWVSEFSKITKKHFIFLRVNICKNHPYWNLGGQQIDSGPFFSDSSYKKRVPGKFSAQTDISGPKYLDS